jgi:hypothetical protein
MKVLFLLTKALFTSRIFEGIGEDYSISCSFPDRLFTRLGLERIISGNSHKSSPH